MRPNKQHCWSISTRALLLLFIASMIWINFHAALWYRMDCYTYAYEGRLMFEARSFFPENWIFSNQFHIVSSPNLAALFYGLTKDSVSAMAFASSLSILLVLLSFLWCFKPFVEKQALWAGALCILGGVILGTDAALYISGLQVLYTMCSYYACYLIGILLTLGIWIRLRLGKHVSFWLILLDLLLNFALGMQSLREMLVLVIPLFMTEFLFSFYPYEKGKARLHLSSLSFLFLWGVFAFELAGHFYMNSLHIPSTPNIGDLALDILPSHVFPNFWASTKNLLRISGLSLAMDGIKYLPLSICALSIVAAVFFALFLIFKNRDRSPLAMSIVFSLLSILCVYGIGIFFMRTRDIYFFVYWLLASLSIVYLLNQEKFRLKNTVFAALTAICCINYCFSFIPDFIDNNKNHNKLESFAQSLADNGVRVIYMDGMPVIAAASHDRIVSQSYWLDYSIENGYPLTFFPSDKHITVYNDAYYANSLICISDTAQEALDQAPDDYKNELMDNLVFIDQITIRGNTYRLFQTKKRIISPSSAIKM